MQEEPLDNKYRYYAVNYSNDEVCDILRNNKFDILLSKERARTDKSNIGIIIAMKKHYVV